jgi:hypothetical protein
MRPARLRAISVLLLFTATCLASLAAADGSAVLKSSGSVALNGAGVPTTTAIFSGDTVRTASGSALTISAPGSTILLPQNSQLTYKGNSVDLSGGKATVTTTKGMSVAADRYLIQPGANGTGQYEIEKSGESLLVHASKGTITIKSSGKVVTLTEGQVAALNAQSGVLSIQPASLPSAASGSNSSLNTLHDSLVTNDGLPICPSVSMCNVRPSVSGIKPCKCKQF